MLLVGTGDTFETLDALGEEFLEGVMVVVLSAPGHQPETTARASAAYLAAYRANTTATRSRRRHGGLCRREIMIEALNAAGSTEMEKVAPRPRKWTSRSSTYATGFGVKFDENFQNTRAFPVVAQWQDGKMVTVFPLDATPEGAKLADMRRK